VYAGNAEEVDLCLFDPTGRHELRRHPLNECTDGVWHAYLPDVHPGQLYGYRAHGPYEPEQGLRYNVNKLLLDPYARRIAGTLRWSDAVFGYRMSSARVDLSFDRRDSAFAVPKAVVTADHFDWGDDRPPHTPWSDTVIYEMHVRGFSQRLEIVPEAERGTFGALGHAHTIDYFRRLGITAIELLPIHACVHDRVLMDRGLVNYWGYNTLAYFVPEPRYLTQGSHGQLKWAIKRLHAAGIEVLLDVVYNHTCEGSELGPTLSLRGLDNLAYYRLLADNPRHCINDTGCGNTLNFSHPRVIQLAMDSLRYWVTEFHLDGFRFDLGATLGRETSGFDSGAGFFDALMQDPILAHTKLISEPWDLGSGGYQLGNHPAGMSEWNDKFRDEVRKFWRGDSGLRGALAARLQGSAERFDHHRRRPWASLNFLTSHDGFTLQDCVSYNDKHNEANGEDNRDGADDNGSSNWGNEGPSDDPQINEVRARVKRAMLATLLFSHGTPMLLSGDEFGRTQNGNNNPYCQDNALSWLNWVQADAAAGREQRAFVAQLLALRSELRTLRSAYFQHGRLEPMNKVRDIEWFDERGLTLRAEDWGYYEGRLLAVRRAERLDETHTELTLLLFNSTADTYKFELPPPAVHWRLRLDTAAPDATMREIDSATVEVGAHSVHLLAAIVEGAPPDNLPAAAGAETA
jgi:glycogen operon protein